MAGELYTWGDGTHYAGLLGHGTDVSHWIPKRISGPLEGLQVAMVTCGPWHTALITSTGQLFTFGDGTFGVLGHGNRENASYPREVDSLSGLRTIAVACGVWHTAAVVEVIVTQSSASVSSGKLFTWGDGDKNRLGQGDKEPRLKPTCVPALIDYNFHKVACGHSLTVGLTTSGRVFTMGSTVYGQLGNPQSDGKLPCLVEDKLAAESVEEISCGAYHKLEPTAGEIRPRLSGENKDRLDKADLRLVKSAMPSNFDLIKQLDTKAAKQGKKGDTFSLGRSSQVSLSQLREAVMSTAVDARRNVPKPILTASVLVRGLCHPSRENLVLHDLRRLYLQHQVESLKNRCELQELEIQQSAKKAQEAMTVASEESAKCKAAKEVIKSLTAQLKDMAERLPPGAYDPDSLKLIYQPNGLEPNGTHYTGANGEKNSRLDPVNTSYLASHPGIDASMSSRILGSSESFGDASRRNESSVGTQGLEPATSNGKINSLDARLANGGENAQVYRSSMSENLDAKRFFCVSPGQ
ncbi:hypothetical protein DH2020_034774 [Rehmannia glutinosa]|uniref:Transcription factor BREVIS RADIX N-terminal domain-containing protein n=1 Tax=Rehmannia glutinosa TaxID=99300 RepID=A0ABR0V8Y1_REHGL